MDGYLTTTFSNGKAKEWILKQDWSAIIGNDVKMTEVEIKDLLESKRWRKISTTRIEEIYRAECYSGVALSKSIKHEGLSRHEALFRCLCEVFDFQFIQEKG